MNKNVESDFIPCSNLEIYANVCIFNNVMPYLSLSRSLYFVCSKLPESLCIKTQTSVFFPPEWWMETESSLWFCSFAKLLAVWASGVKVKTMKQLFSQPCIISYPIQTLTHILVIIFDAKTPASPSHFTFLLTSKTR